MGDFELATAEEKLRAARLRMREYFDLCYVNSKPNLSKHWQNLFNTNINKALRGEALYFNFGHGGSPTWYAEIFTIFSELLLAEYEHGKIMAAKFNPPEFETEEI